MKRIVIKSENIKLDQFIKWAAIAPTGGVAKEIIAAGKVKVNGIEEKRRGKTLKPGDVVEVLEIGTFLVEKN